MRRGFSKGLRYTIDLSKIADRENPRTVEAPMRGGEFQLTEEFFIDWGDGNTTEVPVGTTVIPTHTYADGAGDVFQVVLRNTRGQLPKIAVTETSAGTEGTNPTKNLTLAIISVDHFAGVMGASTSSLGIAFYHCANLKYIDTRIAGGSNITGLNSAFSRCTALEQPIKSFCLDFLSEVVSSYNAFGFTKIYGDIPDGFMDGLVRLSNAGYTFRDCGQITYMPVGLLDKCVSLSDTTYMFLNCNHQSLVSPCVFWKEDWTIDSDKHPSLTAEKTAGTFAGCNATLRAKVPTAYGGTMTVS